MSMSNAYLNATADYGKTLITHIGLVNAGGVELNSAGYARKPLPGWTAAAAGLVRPTADMVFNVAAGDVVAAWRGYSALTGGTDYGGADVAQKTFANPGTYTLLAASTGIDHDAV
jgi:hypothetical protein